MKFSRLLACALAAGTAASALEFGSMGNIAPSMGYAGVAAPRSDFALFYNPALLADGHGSFSWQLFELSARQKNLMELSAIDESTPDRFNEAIDSLFNIFGDPVPSGPQGLPGVVQQSAGAIFMSALSEKYGNFTPVVNSFIATYKDDAQLGALAAALQNTSIDNTLVESFGADTAKAAALKKALSEQIVANEDTLADSGVDTKQLKKLVNAVSAEGFAALLQAAAKGDEEIDASALIKHIGEVELSALLDDDLAHSLDVLLTALEENQLELSANIGLEINAQAGWGFGIYGTTNIGARTSLDPARKQIIVDVGEEGQDKQYIKITRKNGRIVLTSTNKSDFDANSALGPNAKNRLQASALALVQIPIGYAHKFELAEEKNLLAGGAVRVLTGMGYSIDKSISLNLDGVNGDELKFTDDLADPKISTSVAIDAGALYVQPLGPGDIRLGAVAKNLNAPSFELADGSKIKIKPQFRLGAAYEWGDFSAAIDVDATKNESILGRPSRMIGGGVRYDLGPVLSLRGGLAKDLERSDEGVIMTAGLGLFKILDIAAAASSKKSTCSAALCGSDTDVPRYVDIRLKLGYSW